MQTPVIFEIFMSLRLSFFHYTWTVKCTIEIIQNLWTIVWLLIVIGYLIAEDESLLCYYHTTYSSLWIWGILLTRQATSLFYLLYVNNCEFYFFQTTIWEAFLIMIQKYDILNLDRIYCCNMYRFMATFKI
jgi:hypothetical protein